jgi:hypothetical protein
MLAPRTITPEAFSMAALLALFNARDLILYLHACQGSSHDTILQILITSLLVRGSNRHGTIMIPFLDTLINHPMDQEPLPASFFVSH